MGTAQMTIQRQRLSNRSRAGNRAPLRPASASWLRPPWRVESWRLCLTMVETVIWRYLEGSLGKGWFPALPTLHVNGFTGITVVGIYVEESNRTPGLLDGAAKWMSHSSRASIRRLSCSEECIRPLVFGPMKGG